MLTSQLHNNASTRTTDRGQNASGEASPLQRSRRRSERYNDGWKELYIQTTTYPLARSTSPRGRTYLGWMCWLIYSGLSTSLLGSEFSFWHISPYQSQLLYPQQRSPHDTYKSATITSAITRIAKNAGDYHTTGLHRKHRNAEITGDMITARKSGKALDNKQETKVTEKETINYETDHSCSSM